MLPQSSPLLESAISKPYSHLTSAILNPKDLATRASSKSHDIRDQELRTHRAELAKEQLLQRGLEMITTATTTSPFSISRSGSAFPKRLRETLNIFTHAPTSPASLQMVSPKFDDFWDPLTSGFGISAFLRASVLAIAKTAYYAETSVLVLTRMIGLSPPTRFSSARARRNPGSPSPILKAHPLEGLQKAILAKSAHLSIVAESMARKLEMLEFAAQEAIYDPGALDAL